jgi:hypothetical protein
MVWKTLSRKNPSKKGLMEWLKVKTLVQAPVPHTQKKFCGMLYPVSLESESNIETREVQLFLLSVKG